GRAAKLDGLVTGSMIHRELLRPTVLEGFHERRQDPVQRIAGPTLVHRRSILRYLRQDPGVEVRFQLVRGHVQADALIVPLQAGLLPPELDQVPKMAPAVPYGIPAHVSTSSR